MIWIFVECKHSTSIQKISAVKVWITNTGMFLVGLVTILHNTVVIIMCCWRCCVCPHKNLCTDCLHIDSPVMFRPQIHVLLIVGTCSRWIEVCVGLPTTLYTDTLNWLWKYLWTIDRTSSLCVITCTTTGGRVSPVSSGVVFFNHVSSDVGGIPKPLSFLQWHFNI